MTSTVAHPHLSATTPTANQAGQHPLALSRRTTDQLVETAITAVSAYGSFIVAERFHCSGVLASLTAGLLVGNVALKGSLTSDGQAAVKALWDFAAFMVNSVIFLLIGVQLAGQRVGAAAFEAVTAIAFVLLGRAASTYGIAALFRWSERRLTGSQQHVLFWGGLRGALALALALGLPEDLPYRQDVVTITFAVAAFSIVVQGLTMPALLERLGEVAPRKG